ncbi:MAG: hypothetical protein Q8O56_00275 [Solirubrobacteraceae bacterium]|nr:hypothetical protein [Solirubrobacteraceae bacterium]
MGTVTYDRDGNATVTVNDQGIERKVTIAGDPNSPKFDCPDGIEEKLSPYDILAGKMQLASDDTRKDMTALERRHPDSAAAPKSVIAKWEALQARDKRLVARYNRAVDKRNAILDTDCTTE